VRVVYGSSTSHCREKSIGFNAILWTRGRDAQGLGADGLRGLRASKLAAAAQLPVRVGEAFAAWVTTSLDRPGRLTMIIAQQMPGRLAGIDGPRAG
jgi:hypothetical protein